VSTTPVFISAPVRTKIEARMTMMSLAKPAKASSKERMPVRTSATRSSSVVMSTGSH
jgi:hypothetical protein